MTEKRRYRQKSKKRVCLACRGAILVYDTRDWKDYSRSRSYRCVNCQRVYTTLESPLRTTLSIVKKNGTIELYHPEKLQRSIEMVAYKHELPKGFAANLAAGLLDIAGGEEPIESSHGVMINAARRMAKRDPGLAVRYLIGCMDATFADIITIAGWVRDWVLEADRIPEKQHENTGTTAPGTPSVQRARGRRAATGLRAGTGT